MTRITDEAVEALAETFVRSASKGLWEQYTAATKRLLIDNAAPTSRAALEAALPHLEGATPVADFRGVYEAAAALQTAEDIAEVVEEYADDLEPPTTVEWLELRSWFKGLLHELAARAREIGGAS